MKTNEEYLASIKRKAEGQFRRRQHFLRTSAACLCVGVLCAVTLPHAWKPAERSPSLSDSTTLTSAPVTGFSSQEKGYLSPSSAILDKNHPTNAPGQESATDSGINSVTSTISATGTSDSLLTPAPFSYEKVRVNHPAGTPGVELYGFYNTTIQPIPDAVAAVVRAQQECRVSYDTVRVGYDRDTDMWMVLFSTEGTGHRTQAVYLDRDGITRLILYQE